MDVRDDIVCRLLTNQAPPLGRKTREKDVQSDNTRSVVEGLVPSAWSLTS